MAEDSLSASWLGCETKPLVMARWGREARFSQCLSGICYLITFLCFIFISSFVSAQGPVRLQSHADNPFVISVHVNMVVLHATVLDRKNFLAPAN